MDKRTEIKNQLWRLDEDVTQLSAEVSRRTGAAWKAYVEHEDALKHLEHARNMARTVFERLHSAVEQFEL